MGCIPDIFCRRLRKESSKVLFSSCALLSDAQLRCHALVLAIYRTAFLLKKRILSEFLKTMLDQIENT